MPRRKNEETNSLELLLDTMTNAFGGVLFLSILLSVQLKDRTVVSAPQPDLESELTRMEAQREILRMKVSAQAQQKELSEKFLRDYADASEVLAIEHLNDLKEQVEELLLREKTAAERIARIQEQETESARRVEQLAKEREAVEEELLRLRAELKTEREKRTISGRLPRRKRSTKLESAICLKHDRIYRVYESGRYNSNDLFVDEGLLTTTLKPKPGRGIPISDSTAFGRTISQVIDADPSTHHVTIAVWSDSFDKFQTIKKHIIAAGFEYRIVMMQDDEAIRTGGGVSYTQ